MSSADFRQDQSGQRTLAVEHPENLINRYGKKIVGIPMEIIITV